MPAPFTGGCACGAIRYTVASEPLYMGNCHCQHCQQATGSAFLPAVLVKEADFTLERGEPRWHERDADKGHVMRRAFCGDCGSPVFLINGARDGARVLYAGSLDDPSWYTPSREIYATRAQPWVLLHPGIPHDDEMPQRR